MVYLVCFPQSAPTSFLLNSFLLLTIVHLAKQQINISGACQARCERHRPTHSPYAFKFFCRDKEACTRDCESCPKQVCDETTGPYSYENWHCPAIDFKISYECNNYCNRFRFKGNPAGVPITCQYQIDQKECKRQCEKCSKFFCDSENNDHVLYCPWDKFDGNCKLECDKTRVRYHDVYKLQFRCSQFYMGQPKEEQLCVDTLHTQCPLYIWDNDDLEMYHCPSATDADLSGECKAFCANHTKDEAKIVNCIETFTNDNPSDAERKCENICRSCNTPQGINYVCDPANPKDFHCPRDAPEILQPVPLIRRSYKGPCKHRCDVSQGGGPQAFSLYCKNYETSQERQRCVQICTEECLEKDCHYYGKEDAIILCKGDKQKVEQLRKEEEERKTDQWREQNSRLARHEHAIDELIIILVVVGILLGILIIVFILACWWNKKKMKVLQQPNGQLGQSPEQMATNPSVGIMGSGGPTPTSRPFSTGPTPIGGKQTMQVGSGVPVQGQMAPPPPPLTSGGN